ncbi:MAG TPA: helix-turn-helix transcriptional regulator [Kouleothrix sp.]|nr:helix-turn-helix transcriptional regulator [Kouleothrix sp.]
MGKIVSKARQLRLDLQAKEGKTITVGAAADRIGIDRKVLTRIELSQLGRIDAESLMKICVFYTEVLGRKIDVGDILEYDPDAIQSHAYVGTPQLSRAMT